MMWSSELNAHPRRLDIDWRWIDYAMEKNVLLSVDPDAHSIEGFDDCRYGVLAAQKRRTYCRSQPQQLLPAGILKPSWPNEKQPEDYNTFIVL